MRIHQEKLEIRTNGKGLYEITDEVQATIDKCGVRNGTATVFVQHTSSSVIIMENADPTARRDLEEFFDDPKVFAAITPQLDQREIEWTDEYSNLSDILRW